MDSAGGAEAPKAPPPLNPPLLSGDAYLSNWVCVWSKRRPGGLSAGAMVYGRSRHE